MQIIRTMKHATGQAPGNSEEISTCGQEGALLHFG